MIAIIDHGMGNLRSVQKAFEAVGHTAIITREPRTVLEASHVVLPGVGAFADCMANLDRYGLITPIRKSVASGKPFLGICLGLQVLFTESEEFGVHEGLGVLAGRVKKFPWGLQGSESSGQERIPISPGSTPTSNDRGPCPRLKVPHMGWNSITIVREAPPLRGLASGEHFYFLHSYYVEPLDESVIATVSTYGLTFVSSIWYENVFACQFHPEKSQGAGLRLIRNFGLWRT